MYYFYQLSCKAVQHIELIAEGSSVQAVLSVTPDLPLEDVLKGVVSRMSEDCLTSLALPILHCLPQLSTLQVSAVLAGMQYYLHIQPATSTHQIWEFVFRLAKEGGTDFYFVPSAV